MEVPEDFKSSYELSGELPGRDSIYGEHAEAMTAVLISMLDRIETIRTDMRSRYPTDPVDHCLARIKSDKSMREKCRRRGLPETTESALYEIRDAIGVRIVCGFLKDVYRIRDYLVRFEDYELVTEKDYIRHAKSNGYRSYHMILRVNGQYYVELQLRTISMDTWAALEHQLRYKKEKTSSDALIAAELKRCADELASTDVSMQAIKDMIEDIR
jgi:ppGpp synthetase/RelA/SpoT-type nucleotidyltranferase